jgi:integrase/recombinase XerD
MKKMTMDVADSMTFEEACEKYLENCRVRNLREGSINHYKHSYKQFYKFFAPETPIVEIDAEAYKRFVLYLKSILDNDITINTYLKDFITTMHFLMNEGYIQHFKMQAIKADKHHIETYTESELQILLKKPNIRKCSFTEFQAWVITTFLFSTGVRERSLVNIRVKDIDFDNNVVHVNVTKNRKPLIVPIHQTMANILKEFLKYRKYKNRDDFLFCNVYGQPLAKSTCYYMLYHYNKRRGVETTGIHRYRHTFAKQWILNGGNVVALSKMLGHSGLDITQNYINVLVSDVAKEVNEINLLDKFSGRTSIKMR